MNTRATLFAYNIICGIMRHFSHNRESMHMLKYVTEKSCVMCLREQNWVSPLCFENCWVDCPGPFFFHFLIMPCFICTIRRCHLQGLRGAESTHRYPEHLCASWPSCRDYDEDFFFLMNMRSRFWDHCKIPFYFSCTKKYKGLKHLHRKIEFF